MNLSYLLHKVLLLGVVFFLIGCEANTVPPAVGEIQAEPADTIIETGKTANLTISVSGTDLQFKWTVIRGGLTDPINPAVIYTAPDTPGSDTVTVKVTNKGGSIIKNIKFEVVAPPPTPTPTTTETPIPTETPTATPVPEPSECQNPSLIKNVFPWFLEEEIAGQFSFYGPLEETRFSCKGVYNIYHSLPMAVHLKFDTYENNFGFWGIGVKEGFDSFDITGYGQICFWAYSEKPDQAFRLKLRQLGQSDQGVIITIDKANLWQEICTELTEFSNLGVRLDRLENINLGLEADIGSAEIWVDDFEFRE